MGIPVAARRALLVVLVVVALVVGVGLLVRMFIDSSGSTRTSAECNAGDYTTDTDQAAVASTMVGVVLQRGLPERAAVLVLAAGLQESKLRNLASGDGDRDSVGVLQQRPSQGWGTVEQLSDVHYATGKFLDALVKVPSWQTIPLADAVQAVQISADGSAYARHEPEAQALADALTGSRPAGLSCSFGTPTLVAGVDKVASQVSTDLPINAPTISASDVSVPGASWATAAWFVANADRLGIETVRFAAREWSRSHGWRTDTSSDQVVVASMYRKA
ncbi:MAG: hypothetical protein JO147_04675 [Actinobacteria bacterium]|nr:hypothetical protein [Actinomycetota bacterium]